MKILWNKLTSFIDTPLWLEIFLIVILILRIPSFFEPYYYGDEMIYLTLGEGLRQGVPFYSGLHDNKPPLLYLTAAIAGNLFLFKVILAFWSLGTVYVFWKLANHLFPKKETLVKISTFIFGLLTTLPLLEGNTVNAELFMIGPTMLAFWILLAKKSSLKNLFISGILFSVSTLFKVPAAFDILGIGVVWLIYLKLNKKSLIELVKKVFFVSLGFAAPIVLSFIWYYMSGGFKDYLIAGFLQNFGYVSSWKRSGQEVPFLVKNAPLLIRFGLMSLGFFGLWFARNKLSKNFVFISAWLFATLFAVTLSERPYPHYFVQSAAPVALLLGMLFSLKNVEQSLTVIPLMIAFFVPFYYKFWYYPTTTYYQRFINFALGKISKEEYFNGFSPNINMNYKIADLLVTSSTKKDRVFVWSNDSSAIYSLARRIPPIKYVADYHIIDFSTREETLKNLAETKPKFIVITPNSFEFEDLKVFVSKNYYIISEIDSSQIWLTLKESK